MWLFRELVVAALLMAADEHARQLNLTPVRRVKLLAVPSMALCSLNPTA